MANEPKKTDNKKEPKINVTRSADYSVIYADSVRTTMSSYDIKMTFSINERLPNNDILITETLTVAMSPQHMKDFAAAMQRNVEKYEDQFIKLQDATVGEDSLENRIPGKDKR